MLNKNKTIIKAIIIDDDEFDRTILLDSLTRQFPSVEVLAVCKNAKEGKAAIKKHHPALVFSDIELEGQTAFDMLKELGNIDFEVIFITSYQKYAIQAIKFSALDYLKKPFKVDELDTALKHFSNKQNSEKQSSEQFDTLFHNLNHPGQDSKKIVLPSSNGLMVVQVNEIIRCQSDVNYTTFFLMNKTKIVVAKTLGNFEELLDDYGFVRVHTSHLINLYHVKNYIRGEGGSVTMDDGSEVMVSRRKKVEFLKRLAEL